MLIFILNDSVNFKYANWSLYLSFFYLLSQFRIDSGNHKNHRKSVKERILCTNTRCLIWNNFRFIGWKFWQKHRNFILFNFIYHTPQNRPTFIWIFHLTWIIIINSKRLWNFKDCLYILHDIHKRWLYLIIASLITNINQMARF